MRSQKRWLRALYEPLAGVQTTKSCITIGDVHSDGDYKLILVDEKQPPPKMVLYFGLTPQTQTTLSDRPAAIVTFYSESGQSPCIAVASGNGILIYRNMKPFYRFAVPQEFLHPPEIHIWEAAKHNEQMSVETLKEGLKECLKDVGMDCLTDITQQFMGQKSDSARQNLLERVRKGLEDLNFTNVRLTCMTTMKRNQQKPDGVDVLVAAAEMGGVYWVDTQAFTLLEKVKLKQAPDLISTLGLFDVEYRTFVVCREGDVVILKKSGKSGLTQHVFYLRNQPICMAYSVNQLVFSTRDHRLMFYSIRGKCLNEIQLESPIHDIETFHYEPRQYKGVLVAIQNEIRLYVEMFLVDVVKVDEAVSWLRFGKLGREEGVLLFGTASGGLYAKIFRRTATLEERAHVLGPPAAQNQKLNVPRRTKAFIDQSLRERDNPQRLHKIYQRDLFMLKYNTVKTFAALQSGETGLLPSRDVEPIDFNVELLGFGPIFKVIVNVAGNKELPSARRVITFIFDRNEYTIKNNMIILPDVLPIGVRMKFSTHITCLYPEKQATSELKVLMIREKWKQPIFSSTVTLPVSEPDIN
ncbi:unnamed protein product [Bursaphelenchus xylophilus]|uniref:(pine wood nematode) hypothetical protein n=1 Tax=Bursaphelenchus xylophilus TaxID=6326 RepID=A0A1I7SV49_BURXY|nr:unnamed protein product [Bursaphelenchus xylophilus]CAG9100898.1 unnamed protein product [Bursaphelenchus xylophilus]